MYECFKNWTTFASEKGLKWRKQQKDNNEPKSTCLALLQVITTTDTIILRNLKQTWG